MGDGLPRIGGAGSTARWSDAVAEADWIGGRLAPFGSGSAASVIPCGFKAYARVLHPATRARAGGPGRVRWAEVAAWSGLPLWQDARFHSVAFPATPPAAPAPWKQGPLRGTLDAGDAAALAHILRAHTATPERCWFCLWDGYGWEHRARLASTRVPTAGAGRTGTSSDASGLNAPPEDPPDPIPAEMRAGPRVRLPHRDYLLFTGPVEAASAFVGQEHQTPNLWWPADRIWCVASEIDLPWTYVGGSEQAVRALLSDARIEALPASPGDPLWRVEGWVARMVEGAALSLLGTGAAVVHTSRGTVRAWLDAPGGSAEHVLRTEGTGSDGAAFGNWCRIAAADADGLRRELALQLTPAVVRLAGE